MGRQRKRLSFIGQTGAGKSTIAEMIYLERVRKFNEPFVIYDKSGQGRWKKYPAISLQQFRGIKSGVPNCVYRIHPEEDWQDFFEVMFTYYRRGMALCEDAGHYLPDKKDDDIYSNIISLRHPDHDIDIGFTTHAISETPRFILRHSNELLLWKTGDNWKDVQDRIRNDKIEEVRKVFDYVNASSDPHEFDRVVLNQTGKY